MDKIKVLILMGSGSDREVMEEAARTLAEFGVPHRMEVASAHRSPEKVRSLVRSAEEAGCAAFICGAGWAAHLAGAVAALTVRPVIGVPLATSPLGGLDALLSTVQMPGGVPVATVALGKGGARNAALLAVSMLALSDRELDGKLRAAREEMAR